MNIPKVTDTRESAYTERLDRLGSVWWKRLFNVQAPYRWNIRRLKLGFVLDIGCGIGRHLSHLDGNGIGVDHNLHSVEFARARGLRAFTPDEFKLTPHNRPDQFDSLLISHVLEHMTLAEGVELIRAYLPVLKNGGKVVMITPQERTYRADPTHVDFIGFDEFDEAANQLGLQKIRHYSFPFPRWAGKLLPHVEFVGVYEKRIS